MRTASTLAEIVKVALVRATYSHTPVGHYSEMTPNGPEQRYYTPDFTQDRNLYFVDRYIIPRAKKVLEEGDRRGQTMAMKQIFGAHALYAVQLGTVEAFTFNEISGILFPENKEVGDSASPSSSAVVIAFPGAAPR